MNQIERKRSYSPNIAIDSQDWDDDISQSLLLPKKKAKGEHSRQEREKELNSTSNCEDCKIIRENVDKKDRRNILFGELVAEELSHIQPCLRTRTFTKILTFLNETKGSHSSEIKYDTQ